MQLISIDQDLKCFHCGDECDARPVHFENKSFCCSGCKSIYEILKSSDLAAYYELESYPGSPQTSDNYKFVYLDNPGIVQKLLDFSSRDLQKVTFYIPSIHCSSCIWLLEHLQRLHQGVLSSRVDLGERELSVDYHPELLTLRKLVELLSAIGYEPSINLEGRTIQNTRNANRSLILKIAVAGFCFGNIMLLSFPEYLGLDLGLDKKLATWFSWIMLLLSLPVIFYCASGYFASAIKGLRQKYLNIDVPIVLGIIALAARSYYEIWFDIGPGYLDSLSGLLFLLLVGRWIQNKTYSNLSFNRDFKSYFPLAVTRISNGTEASVLVEELQVDDVILIRNKELVPADSILMDRVAKIDYSFVSGESQVTTRHQGDYIFAGGRQIGLKARYKVIKAVSQSYLTQLWNHQAFKKTKQDPRKYLINGISKYFTAAILVIATGAAIYWWMVDPVKSVFVFTSVLIVACPCALAMATPFTLGNVMRVMGKNMLYLKNAQVLDRMAEVSTLIFDKTGTLTQPVSKLTFSTNLEEKQARWLSVLTAQSSHPLSQDIHIYLKQFLLKSGHYDISDYQEHPGQGISAIIEDQLIKLGAAQYVGLSELPKHDGTYYSINGRVIGVFHGSSQLRPGLVTLFERLSDSFKLALLSGDNDADRVKLSNLFPSTKSLFFRQKPLDKLKFVEMLQVSGEKVMMLGDGLNDAGALQKSDVGIAVTERPHQFTPASDGILHASAITRLFDFIRLAKWSRVIIVASFGLSFLYNIVGLSFAVSGNLTPLTAAILMPLSSISVVLFATATVNLVSMRLKLL